MKCNFDGCENEGLPTLDGGRSNICTKHGMDFLWYCNNVYCLEKESVRNGMCAEHQPDQIAVGQTIDSLDAKARKEHPVARGVLDYFPNAIMAIANVSYVGNEQHNPGEPMHWAKEKSADHADCIVRHLIQRGTMDTDGLSHTAKAAWRSLALLETELTEGKCG